MPARSWRGPTGDPAQEKYRKAVVEYFSKREDDARADGNKKAVDQIKADRKEFEAKGELPKMIPLELQQIQTAARLAIATINMRKMALDGVKSERKDFEDGAEYPRRFRWQSSRWH